jgi:hypothetical protein
MAKMGRKLKESADYFRHEVSIRTPMQAFINLYGLEGYGVYMVMLESIAQGGMHWRRDGKSVIDFASANHIEIKKLDEILDYLIDRGFLTCKRSVISSPYLDRHLQPLFDAREEDRKRKSALKAQEGDETGDPSDPGPPDISGRKSTGNVSEKSPSKQASISKQVKDRKQESGGDAADGLRLQYHPASQDSPETGADPTASGIQGEDELAFIKIAQVNDDVLGMFKIHPLGLSERQRKRNSNSVEMVNQIFAQVAKQEALKGKCPDGWLQRLGRLAGVAMTAKNIKSPVGFWVSAVRREFNLVDRKSAVCGLQATGN